MREFRRIEKDEVWAGVCTGLAEYTDIDVTLIRVIFVITTLFTLFPFLLYIILALVAPKDYGFENTSSTYEQGFQDGMLAAKELSKEDKQ